MDITKKNFGLIHVYFLFRATYSALISLDWMEENQSMAALVFLYWLESVENLMVVLTRSRMNLLMAPMMFLAGLITNQPALNSARKGPCGLLL